MKRLELIAKALATDWIYINLYSESKTPENDPAVAQAEAEAQAAFAAMLADGISKEEYWDIFEDTEIIYGIPNSLDFTEENSAAGNVYVDAISDVPVEKVIDRKDDWGHPTLFWRSGEFRYKNPAWIVVRRMADMGADRGYSLTLYLPRKEEAGNE